MVRILVIAATLAAGISFTSYAQTTPTASVAVKPASTQGPVFPKGNRAPATNFTGTVYVYSLVKDEPTFNCASSNVTFEPGARSNWHSHPAGQILMVTDGLGYYQEEGQPVRLLHKGEVVKAQPNVKHWHGASPKQAMTHIALNVNTEKGIVTWLNPVTDKEYNSYR
ncbi:(R)-mandelonitrile lyase [Hymenobacter norwichensis]|uniref:(R)-mandelonitrile lyase n=1 Tax=Hymenobacter norwichensis TaxID=223903 RepID=UPI0003B4D51A|nr:cupin domain-containing protein [Hymenobacter norwichensis]